MNFSKVDTITLEWKNIYIMYYPIVDNAWHLDYNLLCEFLLLYCSMRSSFILFYCETKGTVDL